MLPNVRCAADSRACAGVRDTDDWRGPSALCVEAVLALVPLLAEWLLLLAEWLLLLAMVARVSLCIWRALVALLPREAARAVNA